MSFWSLEGLPSYWRKKWFWGLLAFGIAVSAYHHWKYSPSRNPPQQVIVYSTAWCPYCQALRVHLAESGVPYIERDVVNSWDGWIGSASLVGRRVRVPIVLVGHTVIQGYDRQAVDAALAGAGYKPDLKPGLEGSSDAREAGR